MSLTEKLALLAIIVTVLTSVGGWIVQWQVAKMQSKSITRPWIRTAASADLLRIIHAVIWAIIISSGLISVAGMIVAMVGMIRGWELIVYVLFPFSVSIAAITEVFFVAGIRKRLIHLFG